MRILILSLAVALFVAAPAAAQQYFRWVDENGVVHFGQTPPPGVKVDAQTGRLQPQPNLAEAQTLQPGTAATAGTSSVPAGGAPQTDASFGKNAEMCAKATQSLATLNAHSTVVMTDPVTGNGVYLSDSERVAEIARLQNMQSYYC